MKATILLTTNPNSEQKAYETIKGLLDDPRIVSAAHLLGRFDGAVVCDCSDTKDLNELAERLRQGGVFFTETLLHID